MSVSAHLIRRGKAMIMTNVIITVGVFHTHLVAGFLGGFLTGIFATSRGTAAFGSSSTGGAIDRDGHQVWIQVVGSLFIIGLNIFMTSVIMLFIRYVLRIPLRMSDEQLEIGDDAVHGEEAYALFFEGERSHVTQVSSNTGIAPDAVADRGEKVDNTRNKND